MRTPSDMPAAHGHDVPPGPSLDHRGHRVAGGHLRLAPHLRRLLHRRPLVLVGQPPLGLGEAFEIKAGLFLVFSAIFAVLLLVSLVVAERLAPKGPSVDAEDEFVKRYREVMSPYARWLRAGVVVVLSLIVGSQALGQWQNWILFRNSTPVPRHRSPVPPERRLLRVHPAVPAVRHPLDPGGPRRGPAGDHAQPLPERRHPHAGPAAPGPPRGQGPPVGHPRPASP